MAEEWAGGEGQMGREAPPLQSVQLLLGSCLCRILLESSQELGFGKCCEIGLHLYNNCSHKWTEHRGKAYIDFLFPQKGEGRTTEAFLYLTMAIF